MWGCKRVILRDTITAAQVAEQQGRYLAKQFNALAKDRNAEIKPFVYKHLGSMASIGGPLHCLLHIISVCQA